MKEQQAPDGVNLFVVNEANEHFTHVKLQQNEKSFYY